MTGGAHGEHLPVPEDMHLVARAEYRGAFQLVDRTASGSNRSFFRSNALSAVTGSPCNLMETGRSIRAW